MGRKTRDTSGAAALWFKRAVAALMACAIVAGGVGLAKFVLGRRGKAPDRLFAGRMAAGSSLVPGSSGALVFSRFPEGIRLSRLPASGDSVLVCADGVICAGDGVVSVTDRSSGVVRNYLPDSPGVTPAFTTRIAGAVMAVADGKDLVAVTVPDAGKAGFKVKRVDSRGRVLWEREIVGRTPLSLRSWSGGLFVVTALQVKEYPSTGLVIGNGSGCVETKAIHGLARRVSAAGGLVVAGSASSLYAYDLNGELKWCVEPGGEPVDLSVCNDGILAAVRRDSGNRFSRIFVRDFVAMYDVRGNRIWKTELKGGITSVRCLEKAILVGTSSGVVALDYSGRVSWEVGLPSPVRNLEIAPGGKQFYVNTEAGELYSYGLGIM